MKIFLADWSLYGLRRHVQKFGEELVSSEHAAELILSNDKVLPEIVRESLYGVVEGDSRGSRPDYGITRFSFEGKMSEQLAVCLPAWGTCNENLGAEEVGAVGVRFIPGSPLGDLFYDGLHVQLEKMKYTGFVSLQFSCRTDRQPIVVQFGVPWFGLYGLLEGMRGNIAEYFSSPWRLFECWNVVLPVLRGLYPSKHCNEVTVGGLDPGISEHVHLWSKGLQSTEQFVGVISFSHGHLPTACHEVLQLANRLVVPEKQYRTDICRELGSIWGAVRPKVFTPQST